MNSAKTFAAETPSRSSIRRVVFLILRLAVGIGALAWLQKSGALDLHSLARLLRMWPLTLVAVGTLFLDLLLMAVRVSLLFRVQRLSLSSGNALQLTLIGFLFSMVLPGTAGGEIAKFYYASRENQGRRPEIAAALLLDRLIGLFSMILLPLLFAPFFPQLIHSIPAIKDILRIDALLAVGLLLAVILVMSYEPARFWFSGWLTRWPSLQGLWNRMTQAIASYREARVTLLLAVILSLLGNSAFLAVTALAFYATSPGPFALRVFLMAPIGYLVAALPLTPGGLGVGEAAFNALFALAGMGGGAAALLSVRVWNAIVGLFGLAVYLRGMGRIVHWEQESSREEAVGGLVVESGQEPV